MATLETTAIKIGQINDFMYSVETAMLEAAEDVSADKPFDRTRRLHNLIYQLMDMLEGLEKDVDELNGHRRVCDAIYAVNHVNQMKEEIKELKAALCRSAQ